MKTTKAHALRIILGILSTSALAAHGGSEASYPDNERSWKLAQAPKALSPANPPGNALAEMAAKIGELESAVAALKSPKRFIVFALFKYDERTPAQLAGLPGGQTSGLPTADYDWPCDGCAKTGNLRWHAKDDARKAASPPVGWGWTHVGAKSFGSAYEANSWLEDTEEGKFVKRNATAIMTFTTTDYSPVAAGTSAIQRTPRIK